MTYKEILPTNCPPDTAATFNGILLRLVGPGPVTSDDFKSRTALGLKPLPGKECSCAACSLIMPSVTKDKLLGMTKFPKLKSKNAVAVVTVDPQAGVGEAGGTHVDFWLFKSFDPMSNIAKVEEIARYGN
jgi:hypothetical protein